MTRRKTDPVKKNMDKFHKPRTHVDKKKEAKKRGPNENVSHCHH